MHLAVECVDALGAYLCIKGECCEETITKLERAFLHQSNAQRYVQELRTLMRHLTTFRVNDMCAFDMSVVYDFPYHSGMVFRAVPRHDSPVDCIAAGGR